MDAMNFGHRIREARKAKGWSQAVLAKKIGISRPAVTQWEGGHVQEVDASHLRAASVALDKSADWLVYGDDAPAAIPTQRLAEIWPLLTASQKQDLIDAAEKLATANQELIKELKGE
jgi:transcriptional regulator with XRE-family HTH domain